MRFCIPSARTARTRGDACASRCPRSELGSIGERSARAAALFALWIACGCAPPELAPVDVEYRGELTDDDPRAPHDDSPYDEYRFEAEAGWFIVVEMRSEAFDTYLWLTDPGRP